MKGDAPEGLQDALEEMDSAGLRSAFMELEGAVPADVLLGILSKHRPEPSREEIRSITLAIVSKVDEAMEPSEEEDEEDYYDDGEPYDDEDPYDYGWEFTDEESAYCDVLEDLENAFYGKLEELFGDGRFDTASHILMTIAETLEKAETANASVKERCTMAAGNIREALRRGAICDAFEVL